MIAEVVISDFWVGVFVGVVATIVAIAMIAYVLRDGG